ncbi:MAG: phosphoenolpyruvate mutase [Oligoflexia bacterium]|nr:phosphoenolpyruvate mutase [Oligoflexia bacterium]
MDNKFSALKGLITSPNLEFIMEAHNGLSAKIVEEAGFKGIWASGLSMSAALGVRDNNEASWTQVLEVLEFMSDATNIPILVDGDTGYGNFNNMRRLVKKLEQRNVAGVCIEDKLFPKTNSFISGEAQELASIEEFSKKISAAKDTQLNDDFCVVARTEAFIAGWGLQEALKRAEAYRVAGADAILVHSKISTAADIEAFMKEWGNRHPIVIVPTKYYSTPTEKFRDLGISLSIWANHNLRASIDSMAKTSKQIFEEESLRNIEDKVVSVSEVFRLQGADELKEAEKRYLPTSGKDVNSIILAAGQGDLGEFTKEKPKTLYKMKDKTILENLIENFNSVGMKDITVVRGFGKEHIDLPAIKYVDNENYSSTNSLSSLYLAKEDIKENTIISYGDIVFKNYILNDLLNSEEDITIVVDANVNCLDSDKENQQNRDLIQADYAYSKSLYDTNVYLEKISTKPGDVNLHGEFIGLLQTKGNGSKVIKESLDELAKENDFSKLNLNDLLNTVSQKTKVGVYYIKDSWLDINTIYDLPKINEMK